MKQYYRIYCNCITSIIHIHKFMILHNSTNSCFIQVIISVNKSEDIIQSSLLLLPTLLHNLLEHPVVLLQCNELIGQLTSDLINSLKRYVDYVFNCSCLYTLCLQQSQFSQTITQLRIILHASTSILSGNSKSLSWGSIQLLVQLC